MKFYGEFVLITSLVYLTFAKPKCEVPCTREYMPVCGTDGQRFKIFANKCILKNEHCTDGHSWFKTLMDNCVPNSSYEENIECNTPCTKEYVPVCGTDGVQFKVFPNACVLQNAHCQDGQVWLQTLSTNCDSVEQKEVDNLCEVPCTREYWPVCGTDGLRNKIFANKCVMGNEHCKDGHVWLEVIMDSCNDLESKEEENCEVSCTREYQPICGTDGAHYKIFPNRCVMTNEHCKDGHVWYQIFMDDCNRLEQNREHENSV